MGDCGEDRGLDGQSLEANQYEVPHYVGELDQWAGAGNPSITVEWKMKPAPYQRFILVSAQAGATATGSLKVACAFPVEHSSEADTTDVQGYRWVNVATAFTGPIAEVPTLEGIWTGAIIQIPPHVSGIKLSSTYAWGAAADRLRGITVTVLHFTVQTREER